MLSGQTHDGGEALRVAFRREVDELDRDRFRPGDLAGLAVLFHQDRRFEELMDVGPDVLRSLRTSARIA